MDSLEGKEYIPIPYTYRIGTHMANRKYIGISLPNEMVEEIETIIVQNKNLGFVSITEFVKDSVRRRISKLKENSGDTSEA